MARVRFVQSPNVVTRVAVVQSSNNVCTAIIKANASDPPYEGTFLVDVDNMTCDIGWVYDPIINNFVNPNEETY